jgi:hypothetical protein
MSNQLTILVKVLEDILLFTQTFSGLKLRDYQVEVAQAVQQSIIEKAGRTFVVIFPRQSGKNELQAQIETYLLAIMRNVEAEIVKASPTWKPQSLNAMRRLERILQKNIVTRGSWKKEQGYIYRVGKVRIFFLSAAPTSNVVGATASTLLECDEAQDVLPSKWDKEMAPMAASTNATRIFWGTAWTSQTLLAREKRLALKAEKEDGIKRVFQITADQVRKEVKSYGKFVDGEIARHGRNHPFIRTQYFSEEIDEQSGMFNAERLALMQGTHASACAPQPGKIYAFTIDVGGEEFGLEMEPSEEAREPVSESRVKGHDSTALTIFEIDLSSQDEDLQVGARFLTVFRKAWTGLSQVILFRQMRALVDLWQPHRIVIDATGVGEGLASFLVNAFSARVRPFKFTQSSKSELGWKLISAIESGRYKEYCPDPGSSERELMQLQEVFFEQCRRAFLEVLPGPGMTIRWGVPEGVRSRESGELLHDDLLLSAALVGALSDERWGKAESAVIEAIDPLKEMKF